KMAILIVAEFSSRLSRYSRDGRSVGQGCLLAACRTCAVIEQSRNLLPLLRLFLALNGRKPVSADRSRCGEQMG
ncbi:MAG: hypothetical protein WCG92_17895, partial [Hyphomicrobiales bacterium]